jgi:hypothetical protein
VQDVTVVVDGARAVARAIVEEAGALQEAMAFEPEVVGPWERSAARDRSESLQMPGVEQAQ